jgi:proteasome lid subunit RPN8/RPN11
MDGLTLSREQHDQMQKHVQALAPLEACGLLAGTGGQVRAVLPVNNSARSPVRFSMDPLEQVQAFNSIDAQELELLGIFHSHPAGPEYPSPTDIEEAAYDVIYIIWSGVAARWQARGYRIQNSEVREVPLIIVDAQ